MIRKLEKSFLFIILLISISLIIIKSKPIETLNIEECNLTRNYKSFYRYFSKEKLIVGNIVSNCGIKNYKLEKNNNSYIIVEIAEEKDLLRCVCNREFKIENAEDLKVYHLQFGSSNPLLLEKIVE